MAVWGMGMGNEKVTEWEWDLPSYSHDGGGPSFGYRPDGSTRKTSDQSDLAADSQGHRPPWKI